MNNIRTIKRKKLLKYFKYTSPTFMKCNPYVVSNDLLYWINNTEINNNFDMQDLLKQRSKHSKKKKPVPLKQFKNKFTLECFPHMFSDYIHNNKMKWNLKKRDLFAVSVVDVSNYKTSFINGRHRLITLMKYSDKHLLAFTNTASSKQFIKKLGLQLYIPGEKIFIPNFSVFPKKTKKKRKKEQKKRIKYPPRSLILNITSINFPLSGTSHAIII